MGYNNALLLLLYLKFLPNTYLNVKYIVYCLSKDRFKVNNEKQE